MKYNDYEIQKWESEDGFCCYNSHNICKILGIKNARRVTEAYSGDEVVSRETRTKYNITTYKKYKNEARIDNKMILLTERGLKRFICKSRASEAENLAIFFGFDVYNNKFVSQEADFISALQKTFPDEIITQWIVPDTDYRLDAYMPKYNIAIECDEEKHQYQIAEDRARQDKITRIIKCSWVRFKPDDPNCNIFTTIGEIHKKIITLLARSIV